MSKKKQPEKRRPSSIVRLPKEYHELLRQAAANSHRTVPRENIVAIISHCRALGIEIPPELE